MRFETRAIRVGQDPETTTGAVIVPIYQTANFAFDGVGQHRGYEYTRSGNPTRHSLEQVIASMEEARFGMAFASGMAATDGVLSILRPGDHVVACDSIYGGTYRLFESVYKPRGIRFTYVDGQDHAQFRNALTDQTRMLWIETPTNPLLRLVDIAKVAQIASQANAPLVVDNTFASPYLQRPLTLGASIVLHSTTKYVAGHSDVIGGAVVTNDPNLHEKIAFYQNAAGAVPGPFDCWLTLRGIKTLPVRMRQHCENAQRIAEHLTDHPAVQRVIYPGLPDHPQHELARQQMNGFGGIVSFELAGGNEQVQALVSAMDVFLFAESLGGVESLICHPATMSHAVMSPQQRQAAGISDGLVRLSVGIEHVDDLIADLDQALQNAQASAASLSTR